MAEPLIVITRARVKEGKLEGFKRYYEQILQLIENLEPQLVAFHGFLNEDGSEMTSIQFHPDTASLDFHMRVVMDNWDESYSEYADMVEIVSVEYYGTPSKSALDMDRQSGTPLNIKPRHIAGFTRATSS